MANQQGILHVPQPPRLLDRVRDAIRRRHYSYRTEQTYVHCVKRFIYFHDNSTFFLRALAATLPEMPGPLGDADRFHPRREDVRLNRPSMRYTHALNQGGHRAPGPLDDVASI